MRRCSSGWSCCRRGAARPLLGWRSKAGGWAPPFWEGPSAKRLGQGLTITIGSEHQDATLAPFTLVTASYRLGPLAGVIGVMGPTRMPYDKIVALVDHTSRLVGELLE